MYIDGKLTGTNIINDYDLGGYVRGLGDEGYTFGYPPEEVERLKKEYEDAKEAYEEAVNNMISNKED